MDGKFTFELVKQIGSGQFSEVYKARWLNAPLTPPCPPSPGVQSSLMGPFNNLYDTYSHHQTTPNFLPPLSPNHSMTSDTSSCCNNPSTAATGDNRHQQQVIGGGAFSFDGVLNGNFKLNSVQSTSNGHNNNNNQTQQEIVYGEKLVALKKIKFYDIQNSQQRMNCIKEIRLLQQLNHPNIINYNISFEVRHELYIVLELADGGDIGKLIRYFQKKEKLINEQTILKYFTQICSAVRYIHSRGILHRDIKPANIFMTSEGIVKLGDFGLGRFFSQNTRDAHTLVGTFYYMSPERISGHGYDFSSDIWSLGCVLYELITLYSPFDITNVSQLDAHNSSSPQLASSPPNGNNNPYNLQYLCNRIMRADYPSLAEYNQVSSRLRELATECLNPYSNRRPNMEYICQVVGEAHRVQVTQTTTSSSSTIMTTTTASTTTTSANRTTPRPIVISNNNQGRLHH